MASAALITVTGPAQADVAEIKLQSGSDEENLSWILKEISQLEAELSLGYQSV